MNIQYLKEIGFTDREIKVYIALLELGKSTAGPISSRARLSHTKVYDTLQRLIEKGLVNYIVISKTKYFQAEDPKEILNIIDEKKRNVTEVVEELKTKKRFSQENQGAIVHEGYNAFKSLFNRIAAELTKDDFYYVFALKEHYKESSAPLFFSNFHKKLEKIKIEDRILANIEVKKEVIETYKNNKNVKIRFIKKSTPIGVAIVKDKVIEMIWGELPTAIEINSKQIFEHYKQYFEEIWKLANK